ncbi:MAG TPA: sigma-70 family RNA polymerase sigma factor [Pyrinomonadaceae bacterium]|nr:sigma-70 family RNA polymerase sigma factor [Pyrinomonadaceae bacterium]
MSESLFEEINLTNQNEPEERGGGGDVLPESLAENDSEASLLAALPVIRKIIRRKIAFPHQSDSSDIFQGIVLRLWNWRNKFREKSARMSPTEWESFAARTAYNEINRYFSSKKRELVSLDEASEFASSDSVTGETDAEIESLARFVWQGICRLTLRQRQALLLQDQRLVISLLQGGILDKELATVLDITDGDWLEIKVQMPLSDLQISEFSNGNNRSPKPDARWVKKARYEARAKLRTIISK